MNPMYRLRTATGESGPFSESQVAFKLKTRQVSEEDEYLRDGNADWLPLSLIAGELRLNPSGNGDAISVPETSTSRLVQYAPRLKDRGVYTVLGLLLGFMGVHNFYAERMGPAVLQLGLGLVNFALVITGSPLAFITAVLLLVWVIIDLVGFKAQASRD